MNVILLLDFRRLFCTIPKPPDRLIGTVNDTMSTIPVSKAHESHHWDAEKIIVADMFVLVILLFLDPFLLRLFLMFLFLR